MSSLGNSAPAGASTQNLLLERASVAPSPARSGTTLSGGTTVSASAAEEEEQLMGRMRGAELSSEEKQVSWVTELGAEQRGKRRM